jgi:threonyl-tRNA synthetase
MTEVRQLAKKIRESELNKVPFMLIIGDEEINKNIFPIRAHGGKDAGKMNIDDFVQFIKEKTSETIKEF